MFSVGGATFTATAFAFKQEGSDDVDNEGDKTAPTAVGKKAAVLDERQKARGKCTLLRLPSLSLGFHCGPLPNEATTTRSIADADDAFFPGVRCAAPFCLARPCGG